MKVWFFLVAGEEGKRIAGGWLWRERGVRDKEISAHERMAPKGLHAHGWKSVAVCLYPDWDDRGLRPEGFGKVDSHKAATDPTDLMAAENASFHIWMVV